jgi:phage-related protein
LISGISSMIGNLGSYLGSIGSFIQANKGPIDKDRKLLVGAGQAIMGGLITGIGDKKDALAAELADVTSLVANTALPSLGVEADAVSRSLSVADQKSMLLAWKTGSTGDQLLDAIAGMVDLRFNGNVQAALSRT